MPYSKLSDAPANIRELDGVALTLAQVNWIANIADGIEADDVKSPWAVAIARFKKSFVKRGGKWVKREEEATKQEVHEHGEHECVCPKCGETITVEEGVKCATQDCPECGTRMRASEIGELRKEVGMGVDRMGFLSRVMDFVGLGEAAKRQKEILPEPLAKARVKEMLEATIEGKDLSLEAIRRAAQGIVAPSAEEVAYDERAWVRDIFPDGNSGYAVLEQGKHLYKAPYTIQEDDTLQLGAMTRVTVAYQEVPQATKEMTFGIKVFEGAEGQAFWMTRTTNAFEDLESENFQTKALEDYVAQVDEGIPDGVREFLEERNLPATDQGELWMWHIPGSRIGEPKWKGVEGRFLIEVGTFDDTPLGRAAAAHYKEHGEDYRTSHGYLHHLSDKLVGSYAWLWKFETSPLPKGHEANPWTGIEIIAKEARDMDEEKKKWLVETLGQELADGILAKAQEDSKTLEDLGIAYSEKEPEGETEEPEAPETFVLEKDGKAMELLAEAVAEKLATKELKEGLEAAVKRIEVIEKANQPLVVLSQGFRASRSETTEVDGKDVPEGAITSQHLLDKQYAKRRSA